MNGQLKRQIGLTGAVLLGLGSILGSGVFVSLGFAVGVAGNWALLALGLATGLAAMNALSSAELAANHPVSGGTYAYGRRYLREEAGFVAGLAFVLAKSASAAVAALVLVGYVLSFAGWDLSLVRPLAALLILMMTALVIAGLRRANIANALLVGVTLLALLALVAAVTGSGRFNFEHVRPGLRSFDVPSVLEASALLFVAFTGYGRIATLGEEVREPRRTIPAAIITTIVVTGLLYFAVLISGLSVLGVIEFSAETYRNAAPLQAVARALQMPWLVAVITVAAATAMAGVLLNLILGLSRVVFAMGRDGELPAALGRLDKAQEPRIAIVMVGGFVALISLISEPYMVWSFSAFAVLIYYALTNFSALQLSSDERLYPPIIPVFGLIGCLVLSLAVKPGVILTGLAMLAGGLALRKLIKG